MAKTKVVICPYCGVSQPAEDQCRSCGGLYDELSRQATHNDMGPWYIRMPSRPHQPGCSYETLLRLIERNQIDKYTILRGPTTKQFWTVARRVPGVAHLMGYCHSCDEKVDAEQHGCPSCGVPFGAYLDRNHLGLPEVCPLPWEAGFEEKKAVASTTSASVGMASKAEWTGGDSSRGISSFASDSEMVGNGQGYGSHAGHDLPAINARPAEASVYDHAITATEVKEIERPAVSDSQANRSLRREIQRQQRLINILAVVVVIAIIVAIMTNLMRMSQDKAGDSKTSPPTSEKAVDESPEPQISNVNEARTPSAPPETTTVDPSLIDDLQDPIVQTPVKSVSTLYSEAQVEIDKGENENLAMKDRIEAYQKALQTLALISKEPDAASLAVNLPELIDQCERELEKLRLRQFYP